MTNSDLREAEELKKQMITAHFGRYISRDISCSRLLPALQKLSVTLNRPRLDLYNSIFFGGFAK